MARKRETSRNTLKYAQAHPHQFKHYPKYTYKQLNRKYKCLAMISVCLSHATRNTHKKHQEFFCVNTNERRTTIM